MIKRKIKKNDNVISFPNKLSAIEKEIEAIVFAAAGDNNFVHSDTPIGYTGFYSKFTAPRKGPTSLSSAARRPPVPIQLPLPICARALSHLIYLIHTL